MGIFADWAHIYFKDGLKVIPCGENKQPLLGAAWQRWCEESPNESEILSWLVRFSECDRLGLPLGQAQGIVAFDFDYAYDERRVKIEQAAFEKDKKIIEPRIKSILPLSPCLKIGAKGWTAFYKWNPRLGKHSNMQADRHGVRLFDFLSWHKQTIIPPSLHSIKDGKSILYKWQGEPLNHCYKDLPEIDLDIIKEIKIMFEEKKSGLREKDGSRHEKLFFFGLDMASVEKDHEKLAGLMVEHDVAINSTELKGTYFQDKKHCPHGPKQSSVAWAKRIVEWKKSQKLMKGEKLITTPNAWDYFFQNAFSSMRKDILTKEVMIKRDKKSPWVNVKSLEGTLRTYAMQKTLVKDHVKDELERFVFERTKLDFLCDIPPWDGQDRIAEITKSIHSPSFTHDEIAIIFKQWGQNVFARIENPKRQNRCIILKGPQNIGKDSLIRSMFSDFAPYYETVNLGGTQKDVLEIISRLYILHIEEFDSTKHLDVAFLKSLITQPSAFFRESYGRTPSLREVAVNFISTANVDDILRDPTGNRRFIVIPVESISFDYPQNCSFQVIAQMKALYHQKQFAELPQELEAKIKGLLELYTPPDINEAIVELYKKRAENLLSDKTRIYLTYEEVSPWLKDISKDMTVSLRRVLSVLKIQKLSKRDKSGILYYKDPQG